MRRWAVIIVAAGALVVILLGVRSFNRAAAQKTCALHGDRWNPAAHRCEEAQ
jgi:hypothetical protein